MSYRSSIVAFYARNPDATQEQARRATGAPKSKIQHVYAQLVACGLLTRRPQAVGRERQYGLPPSRCASAACAGPTGLTA